MVNLTGPNEQPARPVGERGSSRGALPPRNHHNWGARFGRSRGALRFKEPTTLAEMEDLAWRSAVLMEKYGGKSENHFHTAMALLRQEYNMNFIMVCAKCKGPHLYDELTAPER